MTNGSGRRGPLVGAVVVAVLVVMVWHHLGGGAWRSDVRVDEAWLLATQRLELIVASCNGAPRVSLRETDVDVQVKVNPSPLHCEVAMIAKMPLRFTFESHWEAGPLLTSTRGKS